MLAPQHPTPSVHDYVIHVQGRSDSFACDKHQNLLQAMQRGARRYIAVGCRGGGCGVCRVRVMDGSYRCERMSREHVSDQDQRSGIALACKLTPESDLHIAVLGLKSRSLPLQRSE